MDDPCARELHVIVLCPSRAPVAHGPGCPERDYYIPPQPGEPGDWSGHISSLGPLRERFPGVRIHTCLTFLKEDTDASA